MNRNNIRLKLLVKRSLMDILQNNIYKNPWVNGAIFATLFVLQQIMAFTYMPFNLVTPYWIFVILVFFVVGLSLTNKGGEKRNALTFALICAAMSVMTIANGSSIGEIITKVLYMLIGYWGYVFICERRIKLIVFDILLVVLYIAFYQGYFQYDVVTRTMMDEDLFGHASSNTIAMILNIVTYFYVIISWVYKARNKKRLVLYCGFNLFLIVQQGSRAGMLVALLLLLIVLFTTYDAKSKLRSIMLFIGAAAIVVYLAVKNMGIIEEFFVLNEISANAYEQDVRSLALVSFFAKMDFTHFLTGYKFQYELLSGIDRSFNAFVDFWKVYGFIPFVYMVALIVKRIIKHKEYEIPLVLLLPFVAYSLFESLWGGTFWDTLLFMILFYSHRDEKNNKTTVSVT